MKRINLSWVGGNGYNRKYDVVVYDGDIVVDAIRGVSQADAEAFTNRQRRLHEIPCEDDADFVKRHHIKNFREGLRPVEFCNQH